jgi:hypothetical protein
MFKALSLIFEIKSIFYIYAYPDSPLETRVPYEVKQTRKREKNNILNYLEIFVTIFTVILILFILLCVCV